MSHAAATLALPNGRLARNRGQHVAPGESEASRARCSCRIHHCGTGDSAIKESANEKEISHGRVSWQTRLRLSVQDSVGAAAEVGFSDLGARKAMPRSVTLVASPLPAHPLREFPDNRYVDRN